MKLELKDINSADVRDFDSWAPSLDETYFPVEMSIGRVGKDTADLYQCIIATPEGLRNFRGNEFLLENRALLVVSKYDWPSILRELSAIISGIEAEDMVEASLKLQRYFMWEYEDYIMDDEPDERDGGTE